MALSPQRLDILSLFSPMNSSPASCSTQELPAEEDANILLLGCGDIRKVLYTTYCDQKNNRSSDFTCCDREPASLARSILFCTLLLDDEAGKKIEEIWAVYFHFYLFANELELLKQQATKLLQLSESLDIWNEAEYGKILRFCDGNTFRVVRSIWQSYCDPNSDHSRILEKRIASSKLFEANEGGDVSGLRSAAPMSTSSVMDILNSHTRVWYSGSTSDDAIQPQLPNPVFASPLYATTLVRYGVNPLLGFHLSLAYANLTPASPFYRNPQTSDDIDKLVTTAKMELNTWSAALRSCRERVTIRVVAGDAIDICRIFFRRRSVNVSVMTFDQSLPKDFNVVDTSNLINHLGAVTVLVSSSRLLSSSPHATLFTEPLIRRDEGAMDAWTRFLLGDVPAISLLLGLYPVEYWTGATLTPAQDHIIQVAPASRTTDSPPQLEGQEHCRMSWKLVRSGLQGGDGSRIHVEPDALSELLYAFFQKMFHRETFSFMLSRFEHLMDDRKMMEVAQYHRGSFVEVLSHMRDHISTDWNLVINKCINLIGNIGTPTLCLGYMQELYAYLYLHSFCAPHKLRMWEDASRELSATGSQPYRHAWEKWQGRPLLICVTVKVPRKNLQPLIDADAAQQPQMLGTPVAEVAINSSASFSGGPWGHGFAALQMLFGELDTRGDPDCSGYNLLVNADKKRWQGSSTLIVSFWAPTCVLLREPKTANICVRLQMPTVASRIFQLQLGDDLDLFKTILSDSTSVFYSKSFPTINTCSYSGIYGPIAPQNQTSIKKPALNWTLNFDNQHRLDTISARLTIVAGPSLRCLQDKGSVTTTEEDHFTIEVELNKGSDSFRHTVTFPVPILWKNIVTRVARTSGYIEVVAPVLRTHTRNSTFSLPFKVLPLTTPLAMWNVPRVHSDLQPTLDPESQQNLDWLDSHLLAQMSNQERELHKTFFPSIQSCPEHLVRMKDLLANFFAHYVGRQSPRANWFGLALPEEGGTHVLIFVSKLKLDVGNQTVFLDAAVLPVTRDIIERVHRFTVPAIYVNKFFPAQVTGDELGLWRQILPLHVERCRTWSHLPSCEYKMVKKTPISLDKRASPMCSCGKGIFPDNFMPDVPHWDIIKQWCYRAAISPLFSIPYVESSVQVATGDLRTGCAGCGKKSQDMQVCGRCKAAKYCSRECQKQHWQVHTLTCLTCSVAPQQV